MNVWLIQIGEPLPIEYDVKKMRTAILAEKLIERGHVVIWWASGFDHFEKKWIFKRDTEFDVNEKIKIIALKGIGYKKNISFQRFIDHRILARKFAKQARKKQQPDIIIASMPSYDLAYQATIYAIKNKIPVIVDVRDQWPDVFLENIPYKIHWIVKLFLVKDFKMVRYIFRNATSLVSMMDSLMEWSLKKVNRERTEKDKVFYLGGKKVNKRQNYEVGRLSYLSGITNKKFVITFIGTFGDYYNPLILGDVAKRLYEENIHFLLCGDGVYLEQVKIACERLDNVSLTGWLNGEEISYVLSLSHVGIVPCTRIVEAFPNKAFSYLSAGIPVLSSIGGSLKEIIEKYKIGFYYPPNNVEILVECIKKLYSDSILYTELCENVERTFDKMFNADKIYEDYAEHIEKIRHEYRR